MSGLPPPGIVQLATTFRLAKSITKCQTAVYKHADLDDLRAKLSGAKGAKRRIVWSDGVFSMEGSIAPLPELLQICREYDAVLVVDDSHATGVLGETGRGTAEHFGVLGEVDVITQGSDGSPLVAMTRPGALHGVRVEYLDVNVAAQFLGYLRSR